MNNCSKCKYCCPRPYDTSMWSENSISAGLDLICSYDSKTDMYVNDQMVCKHFDTSKGWDWNKRRKREYPIEYIKRE